MTVKHCKQNYFCVSQGSAATLFREVGEFTIFLCEISLGFPTPKIINIDSFFSPSYSKYKKGRCFRHSVSADLLARTPEHML